MKKTTLLIGAIGLIVLAGCTQNPTPPVVPATVPSTNVTPPTTTGTTTATPTPKTTPTPQIISKNVSIVNFQFTPASVQISKGGKVTRTNNDNTIHQVYADDDSFQGPQLQPGDSYSHTFTLAGTFGYHCNIHNYMKGTVVVK